MADRLWHPPGDLPDEAVQGFAELAYVVVDERIGGIASLAISDWPRVDDVGRLRFPRGLAPVVVAVAVADLQHYLERNRQPRRQVTRPMRIGDVYAIELMPSFRERLLTAQNADVVDIDVTPIEDFSTRCIDISAQAREAAKAAFYGAVAPVVDADDPIVELARKGTPRA